jgi:two-component system NtrC family sensor kinase
LTGPVKIRRRDEFGELARSLNSMCDQLATAQERVERETSARLEAMDQLRHADRLRTVGRLAAGIAHEIGTPLNVVSGRAEMIAAGEFLR